MPRKGENIYKRKDGRWEGRYPKGKTISGKMQYGYVYGKTYREVKEKRLKAITQAPNPPRSSDNPFEEIALKWFTATASQVKESTAAKYHSILENHILPAFKSIRFEDLTNEKMQDFSTDLLTGGADHGKRLSGKTVADVLSVLRSVLSFARLQGQPIVTNGSEIRIKQKQKPIRVFSRKEQEILNTFLLEHFCLKNTGILLCLFTGIRVGELCALRWDDISLEEHTIFIHQTIQRIKNLSESDTKTKLVLNEPKTASSNRLIPLPYALVDILGTIPNRSGYFLTGTEQRTEPRVMQNHFKQVLKKCQIAHANFHALRHTFATRCIELEFDPKSLSEILGHANVAVTMNRYVHPSTDSKRDQMQRLSKLFAVK